MKNSIKSLLLSLTLLSLITVGSIWTGFLAVLVSTVSPVP